jgi:hypothetical protein
MMAAIPARTVAAMHLLTRTLLVLPLLAAATGFAADKPAAKTESGFGSKKATGPFLTKDDLRKCLDQQDKLKAQDADMVKEQGAIADKKVEIQKVGEDLTTRLTTIDRTNAEAVAGYNDAVQARDKQIDDYQARVDKFNAGIDQNQAAHDQFSQACSNRRYFEEDETAIRKGK